MPIDPPVDNTPILLEPATFARHEDAAKYVEGQYKTRVNRADRSRHIEIKPGAWGKLADGDTITEGAGLVLGTGTVALCTLEGSTLTETGDTVPVYNSGVAIDGPKVLPLEWTETDWSVCVCEEEAVCKICVTVTSCQGVAQAGATITIKQGATTVATGTTGGTGFFCFDVSATGTGNYNVSVAKAGMVGSNKDVAVACPGVTNVALTLSTAGGILGGKFKGCNTGLPGVVFTINGGTYVSDASGNLPSIALPNGTFPWTAKKPPRWHDMTGTVTVASCAAPIGGPGTGAGGAGAPMIPADGYDCLIKVGSTSVCNEALKTTLVWTGPVGTCLVYYAGGFPTGCSTFTGANLSVANGGPGVPCGTATQVGPIAYSIQWQPNANSLALGVAVNSAPPFTTMFTSSAMTSCTPGSIIFTQRCSGAFGGGVASSSSTPTCPPAGAFETHGTFAGGVGIYAVFNGAWTLTES